MKNYVCALVLLCVSLLSAEPLSKQRFLNDYGKLPLRFEANAGQSDARVRFLARGAGYTVFFTGTEAVLALPASILRMELAGADPSAVTSGLDPLPTTSNYFAGSDSSKWRSNVQNYSRVITRSVYAGIDAIFYGNGRQLEYDFSVAPGADPAAVRMRFSGARKLRVTAEGDLLIETGGSHVRMQRPLTYQMIGSEKRTVASRYVLHSAREAGFVLGAYDKSLPVVIDPVLYYGTLLGGSNTETVSGIAIDLDGNAYITGITRSSDFPATPTAIKPTQTASASYDTFVAKINPTGTQLIYSTYFYSSNSNFNPSIAVDAAGNAYVAGVPGGQDMPTTAGVYTSSKTGGFLAKINPQGSALVFATYIPTIFRITCMTIDAAGNVYLAGEAFTGLLTTAGAYQTTFKGSSGGSQNNNNGDGFVMKLNSTASQLIYSTYIGGTAGDYASGIAVDSAGNAIVIGWTVSTNFPTLNPLQAANGGGEEAWVAKLNPTGTALVYSTYLGGSASEAPAAITVDSAGNAYAVGYTASPNFPTSAGAYKTGIPGSGFVTKISPTGARVYSTILGVTNTSTSTSGVAVDSAGNAFIVGQAQTGFPTTAGAIATSGSSYIAELNPTGATLLYSTFVNGLVNVVAVDAAGKNIYAAGNGNAVANLTPGAIQLAPKGTLSEGYVIRLSDVNPPAFSYPVPEVTSLSPSGAISGAAAPSVTVTGNGFAQNSVVRFNGADRATTYISQNQLRATLVTNDVVLIAAGVITVFTPTPGGGVSNEAAFNVAAKTNPTPAVTSQTTGTITSGGPGFVLSLTGTNFLDGSIARWNGVERVTTYLGATQLQVLLTAADIATAGTYALTIVNPGPGGGVSNTLSITVAAAPFAVASVSPNFIAPGSGDITLQVSGSGFTPGMTVRWKGIDLLTTYYSSSLLLALIKADLAALAGAADIVVVNPLGGTLSASLNITITPGAFPFVNFGGIVNGATFANYLNFPGPPFTVSSIFGLNFADDLVLATTIPLPTTLGKVSVRINGILCPLFFVSKTQINFLLPFETLGLSSAYLTVTVNGVASPPALLKLQTFGPSMFTLNQQGSGQGAILLANSSTFAAPTGSIPGRDAAPVARGDYISIFTSGLGPVTNPPRTGEVASSSPLSFTTYRPVATIGGVASSVVFSGLAPGFAGLYQVNVQVPATAPTGDAVSLTLTIGGVVSNTATIAVK